MNVKQIEQIFLDTAYVRMGGRPEELKCAEYLLEKCKEIQKKCEKSGMSAQAELASFEVDLADIKEAKLYVDGKEIVRKGYFNAGSSTVEAPLYYLRGTDPYSLKQCKGKIVFSDGGMGYWKYQDILDNGAVGFITYDGNANYTDNDIDQKELRTYVSQGRILPGVNINAKDAIEIIKNNAKTAKIVLDQEEYKGQSQNVILDMPGEIDEYIVLTAHYDSTSLSNGAYDNMSGSVGILGIADYFAEKPHRYGLRFIWCGSEERGLLGSKAYCAVTSEEELKKIVLNVNLDMVGCIMGKFSCCCTSEEKMVHYMEYFASEAGFAMSVNNDVYSSDSTPFADKGIPAVTFSRSAPGNTATIHNRYDTIEVMSAEQMYEDIEFMTAFVDRMANAKQCPVLREMPEKMKEKLDIYLCRKREGQKK